MGSNAHHPGRVAEWFIAPVLKTDGGTNSAPREFESHPFRQFLQELALYSVDVLKKSAFQDELTNVLELLPVEQVDQETLDVIKYLKRRVKELDEKTKS